MDIHEDIAALVIAFRSHAEAFWPTPYGDDMPSTDQCGYSSLALKFVLDREFPDREWRVEGGLEDVRDPMNSECLVEDAGSGGMIWDGCWRDHYWLASPSLGIICDVTADQFGHDPVIVTGHADVRYRSNITPAAIERHMDCFRKRAAEIAASFDFQHVPTGLGITSR